ncbi:hypothetical protein PUN4_510054 [Paraburkholderia unamae]|uniref:hypothetical protein n=1 Tax=Paraburkholderia unamae TaxID=219649 RepID=UPI001CB137AC|nr:hypothetical protein [Paraburkholderia unamae]CAG9266228.1 hypothetical protein PUN4_510054 [Paraburkholderia unamae]
MADDQKGTVSVKVDRSKMQNKGGVNVNETADGIEISVEDVAVEKIRDQKQQMIQAIGCYNNPGGPTC